MVTRKIICNLRTIPNCQIFCALDPLFSLLSTNTFTKAGDTHPTPLQPR